MKKYSIILATVCILGFSTQSCIDDYELSKDEEAAQLEEMKEELTEFAQAEPCSDASEWDFIAIGVKACGGPTDYIAYNTTIDIEELHKRIDRFNDYNITYNEKWNVSSDCSVPAQPSGVICDNNVPVLTYN